MSDSMNTASGTRRLVRIAMLWQCGSCLLVPLQAYHGPVSPPPGLHSPGHTTTPSWLRHKRPRCWSAREVHTSFGTGLSGARIPTRPQGAAEEIAELESEFRRRASGSRSTASQSRVSSSKGFGRSEERTGPGQSQSNTHFGQSNSARGGAVGTPPRRESRRDAANDLRSPAPQGSRSTSAGSGPPAAASLDSGRSSASAKTPGSVDRRQRTARKPSGGKTDGPQPLSNLQLKVEPVDNDAPLDWLLSRRFPEHSRRVFRKLISEGSVTVNGKVTKRFGRVRAGQTINIGMPAEQKPGGLKLVPQQLDLQVLFEDEHLIAVAKPSGMVVQPCESALKGTVLNGLLYHVQQSGGVAPGGEEAAAQGLLQGIAHRLDKETSGVMVVAKNPDVSGKLAALFKTRTVQKKYLAVCVGDPGKELLVEAPMYRRSSGKMAAAVDEVDAEQHQALPAKTRVRTIARAAGLSFVEAEIFSGRMHQIRVHLAHVGRPVVGDAVYGDKIWNDKVSRQRGSSQMLLHAASLELPHPVTGQQLHLQAPLPEGMWKVARSLMQAGGAGEALALFEEINKQNSL